MTEKSEKEVHAIFVVGLFLKGVNAIIELLLGGMLLFTGVVPSLIALFTHGELIEDPNDYLAVHIRNLALHSSVNVQHFGSIYFFSHGIIKLFLVWALLKNKIWAYPASILFFLVIIIYQVFQILYTHSVPITLLTLFDVVVLWLIWHEYQYFLKKKSKLI